MPARAVLPWQGPLLAGVVTILAGLAVCAMLGTLPRTASAQAVAAAPAASAAVPTASAAVPTASAAIPAASAVARPASAASTSVRRASAPRIPASGRQAVRHTTGPLWTELTEPQRLALAPLAPKWDTVSEAQKRKWIALSRNFPRMSGAEQEKLHSRMSEWVALSPQQRTQARLNFGETQKLSPDDKRAKWEAYQALPPEEKRKLAAGAAKPPATAAAVKPVPAQKLATVPDARKPSTRPPRIAAGAHQVDPNTLLPQQPAAGQN